jgi:predicted phage-related endonuclease
MALTDEQKQARRRGIGGSDARTIMWGDQAAWEALYDEKVNGKPPVFSARQRLLMDLGNAVEPVIINELSKLMPLRPGPHPMVYSKLDNFLFFTPDTFTADGGLPVQCKLHTGNKDIFDLADYYAPQLLHEMFCAGVSKCYLAVIFGHYGRFQHMEIEQDNEALEAYLARAMAFKDYCETGTKPDWMVDGVAPAIPRKRDHVWATGDNMIASLATTVLENYESVSRFEEALATLKDRVPADAASARWVNAEGLGIKITVSRNGAKRWMPLAAPAPETTMPTKGYKPKLKKGSD